ncbi:hypothetical protein B4U80_09375 [Leptotrombidium deliense]|uniref:Peroxin-19 n=1 Tax=Leptotrombidium deliense TaxID=299467 RepID=A0A443SMF1_9ACAR|nr:hypothetical protein B4U80_09375 [Leptotrombidium deliense]
MDADDTRRTTNTADAEPSSQSDVDGDNDDHELNALLQSAFSDFQRQEKSDDTSAAAAVKNEQSEKCEETRRETEAEIEQFLKGLAKKQVSKARHSITGLMLFFSVNAQNDDEFEMSLSETLKNLTENARSLAENSDVSDDELSKIWQNMNESVGGGFSGSAENNAIFQDMMPLVTNMMQSLLSKEVLHPALKDLIIKYPEWLEENKEHLREDEMNRYTRQLQLMRVICDEFDAEVESDSTEVKNERFQKVLKTMQEMQQCGAPPKDLVADGPEFGPDGEFDFSKIPGFPSSGNPSEKCCIM